MSGYADALRWGWDQLRTVQLEQKASILRYTVTGRDPATGAVGTKAQVTGLADLNVVVEDVSERDLMLARGKLDTKDKSFVFYDVEILTDDQIVYAGDTFDIFSVRKVPGTTMIRAVGKRVAAQ